MACVKILTKSEQKKTIKGIQKQKKNTVKNCLESPFALEWPQITTVDEKEIIALVQKSCSGLKKVEKKPPWKHVSKYKGAERRLFMKEFSQKFQENLDPESLKQRNKRKEALSHLIFGYNAVMRALEKDSVAGVLVKKNVEPAFVTKTFLPGCAKKCIPLVPINDLDIIMKDEETLALPHTCMVLGLKPSVKQESNPFNALYAKICKALCVEIEDSSEDDESGKSNGYEAGNLSSKCSWLSETDLKSYHLSRDSSKGRRSFIPGVPKMHNNELESCVDFLGFKSLENQDNTFRLKKAVSRKIDKEESWNIETKAAVDENVDFDSMIVIDALGDENKLSENDIQKDVTTCEERFPREDHHKGEGKVANQDSHKIKRKADKYDNAYVPAKTKRLKGNPYRKMKDQ